MESIIEKAIRMLGDEFFHKQFVLRMALAVGLKIPYKGSFIQLNKDLILCKETVTIDDITQEIETAVKPFTDKSSFEFFMELLEEMSEEDYEKLAFDTKLIVAKELAPNHD